MRVFFSIIIISLLLPFKGFAELEKPPALLNKLVSLGDVSEIQQKILYNHLQTEVSKYFELISQRKFDEAQEQAFQELDYEECTEENCIRYMQDALQVENYFSLQLLKEGDIFQLTLTLIDLDRKIVKSQLCMSCTTIQLNEKINILIEEINSEVDFSSLRVEPFSLLDDETTEAKIIKSGLVFDLSYDSASTNLKYLIPNSTGGDELSVSWSNISIGAGFESFLFLEGRAFLGNGKSDEFYFSSNSETVSASSFNLQGFGFYITPSIPNSILYGAGLDFLQFSFKTSAGSKSVNKTVPYLDIGYLLDISQTFGLFFKYKSFGSGSIFSTGTIIKL